MKTKALPSSGSSIPTGPYAERWFDERAQTHRLRLTDEGRKKVAEYLVQYPSPIALLISTWPSTYLAARAVRLSYEEIESHCLEGVVLAFVRYNPKRRSHVRTAVAWGVRGAVSEAVRDARRALAALDPMEIEERLELRTLEQSVSDSWSERDAGAQLDRHFVVARLTNKERYVLALRFGLTDGSPLTYAAAGVVLGLSRERVRQLQERALGKIREAAGLYDVSAKPVRDRVLDYLTSLFGRTSKQCSSPRITAAKAEIARHVGIPAGQIRDVLARLVREGLVLREREPVSRNRWRILYRLCAGKLPVAT